MQLKAFIIHVKVQALLGPDLLIVLKYEYINIKITKTIQNITKTEQQENNFNNLTKLLSFLLKKNNNNKNNN